MPIPVSACFHEAATCRWYCADEMEEGSLVFKWKHPNTGKELKVTLKGDWRMMDALVWTPGAYMKYVHPVFSQDHPNEAGSVRDEMNRRKKDFPDDPPNHPFWKVWRWF